MIKKKIEFDITINLIWNFIFKNHLSLFFFFSFLVHSQEEHGVLAHMLLIFRFPSSEDPETVNKIIQHVLHKKLQDAVGHPKFHPELVEIKSKFISYYVVQFSYIE